LASRGTFLGRNIITSVNSQFVEKAENPFALAFGISGILFILLLAALFRLLGVSLTAFALLVAAAALLWTTFRYPMTALGCVLAFMPLYPMAILIGRFFGPAYLMSDALKACDRIVLLFLTFILWWKNGIKLKAPDWFLLACFSLALFRLAFGGSLLALLSDFNLMIAYAAGRVTVLTIKREKSWARAAAWIVAVLSILGMVEVFVLGEGPRTLLYLAVADERETAQGALNATFHAEGFAGLRESATMIGPLQFASLCMVGLIVWWVYHRSPLIAVVIAAGLLCTVTRSAWLGTLLAIPLLAIYMDQKKRLLLYASLALGLFIASIPVVGLADYLSLAKKGQDLSAEGHQESLLTGLEYALSHPFGSGPGNVGMYGTKNNSAGVFIENTYLTLAAEYGIPASLCFIGFLLSAGKMIWPQRTQLGYAAIGILVGFGAVMTVAPLHDVFTLASWVWFPVGLAVRGR
jgi:hypothetical protein